MRGNPSSHLLVVVIFIDPLGRGGEMEEQEIDCENDDDEEEEDEKG